MDVIEIREFRPEEDQAFIFSSWLRTYKHHSYFAKRIKHALFFKGHHAVIEHILEKPTTTVAIACPKGDLDTILGYLVYEPAKESRPVIHFVFVKEPFRRMGMAKTLFKSQHIDINNIFFTHWTFPVDELINKHPEMLYDPYGL